MLPFQCPDVFLNFESDLFLKIIFLECAKLFTKKKIAPLPQIFCLCLKQKCNTIFKELCISKLAQNQLLY